MDVQAEIKKVRDEMDKILSAAEAAKRGFSDDEQVRYDGLDIKMRGLESSMNQTRRSIPIPGVQRAEGAAGDYQKAAQGKVGARYEDLFPNSRGAGADTNKALIEFFEKRTILSGTGTAGGFAVPTEMWRSVYNSVSRDSIFLSRMTVFPMGSNELIIPALTSEDQRNGFIGNIEAQIVAEGVEFNPLTPLFREMNLKARKWLLSMNCSHESLADSGGRIDGVVGPIVKLGVQQAVDEQAIVGNGVAAPMGILNSAAAISIPRATANEVNYIDCVKMLSRIHPVFQGGAIWVVSNEAYEQLMLMEDGASNLIWNVNSTQGADKAIPSTFLGRPLFVSDSCSALGDRGDVILVDPKALAFGLREDFILESSNSVEWYKHLIAYRGYMRADIMPMLPCAITPRNGASSLSFATVLE